MDKENNKQLNNKQVNKSVFVLMCIFSAIGVISILGGALFLGMRIADKRYENRITSETIVEQLPADKSGVDVNEVIINDAKEQSEANEQSSKYKIEAPEENASEEEEEVTLEKDKLQIVYFGDSIFDFHREDGTAVPMLTSDILNANYINLAMGGTCASINTDNPWENSKWNSTSGAGMAKAVAGLVDPSVFLDCTAKNLVIQYKDEFANTDIFVIEYGINDFICNHPVDDMDNLGNPTTYQGGLIHMINACRLIAPDATIVFCKPTYCEFWGANGMYLGDYYTFQNATGKSVFDYKGKIECVDNPDDNILSFDPNVENGINIYNNAEYIEDGIHLTEAGRRQYATMLADFIRENCFK